MIDDYVKSYIKKSEENYNLYLFLKESNKFVSWQIVAIFYSALCWAKAYLYSKDKISKNTINSHLDIKKWLVMEHHAKLVNVILPYEKLYNSSRDARYSTIRISNERIHQAVLNYNEVKKLLPISDV